MDNAYKTISHPLKWGSLKSTRDSGVRLADCFLGVFPAIDSPNYGYFRCGFTAVDDGLLTVRFLLRGLSPAQFAE